MLLRRFVSFWLFPLLGAALIWTLPELSPVLAGWLLLGVLTWTLLEYLFHRYVFHWIPRNRAVRLFMAKLHLRHHGAPREPSQILVRPWYSLPISAVLFSGVALAAGWTAAVGVMLGVWAGFLYYEAVHYRIHLSKRSGGLLGVQRRWHFYHHFVDDHFCYGVTSPLWDWVLGTYKTLDVDAGRDAT